LDKAHELVPEDPDVNRQLAKLQTQEGQPQEAKESYRQALPALEKAGRTDELVEAAEKLRELGEDNLELQQKLATGYLEQEEYDKAQEILKKAMVLKSDNLLTLGLMAQAYLGLGNKLQATSTLKRMLRLAKAKDNKEIEQQAQARLNELRGVQELTGEEEEETEA
jgi:Tfp pilus assembly protein PilF